MTLNEWYSTGKYQDIVLIDGAVYPLPSGFSMEPTTTEVSNIVTMASGRRRRDLVRVSTKYRFSWNTATQKTVTALEDLYSASLSAKSSMLYLKKEDPTSVSDYQVKPFDLISPVKSKPRFRGPRLFIYESVTLELE